ncbi:MAG: stage II sporulation protein R [Desulfosporosinus sp.]
MKVVRIIVALVIMGVFLMGACWGPIREGRAMEPYNNNKSSEEVALASIPDQLIRFHVLANSDSEQDQALKRAVRDAILKDVSPRLAVSQSLDESRQILKQVCPDMESIGRSVVKMWGKDYSVRTEYGHSSFPTKSYGSLVLPAGDYEALRVVIGEGQGSNWWCVLFPPLCFIDINQSTAVQVDGKQEIPIKNAIKQTERSTTGSPRVRFYFWEMINR